MEQWRPVPGCEGFYEVSNLGRVRSVGRRIRTWFGTRWVNGRTLSPARDRYGREHVEPWCAGTKSTRLVSGLVAEAFIGPRPAGTLVRHLNDDPADNRVENLAYGTQSDNMADARRNGTLRVGSMHRNAKLTESAVREIRERVDSPAILAREFGVSESVIRNVLARKAWRHVA